MDLFSGLVRMALLLAGCWLTTIAELALVLGGVNELLGLGWWADGYPGLGGGSFTAFAAGVAVLAFAGFGLGVAALLDSIGPRVRPASR